MAERCPYCGSYNTEVTAGKTAMNGLRALGGVVVFVGGVVAGSALGHLGHSIMHGGQETAKKMIPDSFVGHYCKKCKKTF